MSVPCFKPAPAAFPSGPWADEQAWTEALVDAYETDLGDLTADARAAIA